MNIAELIPVGAENAISRSELSRITGLDDRKMREEISQARRDVPIINLQNGDGYFIPDPKKKEDIEHLKKYVKQEERRLKSIGWSLKASRKMLRTVEE